MRSVEDIKITGAAWVTESELAWLCEENARLRAEAEEHFQEASHHADLQLKAEAEVKRLEGLILDYSEPKEGSGLRMVAEAKRIRGEK